MVLTRRRILVRSADRISGSNTSFLVQLQVPVKNLQYAEWVSSTVSGLLVLDKFPNTSMTTNGVFYWRNVLEGQNGYFSEYSEEPFATHTFNVMNVSVLNSDGTLLNTDTSVEIELDLFCESD